MSKTVRYGILIILLLGANLYLLLSDGSSSSSVKDRSYFTSDQLDVEEWRFSLGESEVSLKKGTDGWMVNDEHKADQGFVNTLRSVLDRLEVVRTLENWQGDVLGKVTVGNEVTFQVATNATKTKTYFIQGETIAEVAVPGYRDNVADIFTLHPDQWRDRLMVDGSWRSIQLLKLDYPTSDNKDFTITFDDKFFLVNGQAPSDSTAVVDYLNQFEYFQANEMISSGRFPRFDSLVSTSPMVTLTIDDIKLTAPLTLDIYPNLEGQAYHLISSSSGDKMVVDKRRVEAMLASVSDFGVQ